MNILILEGGDPISNFIERRIDKLSENKSLQIYVHAHLSQTINCKSGNVKYLYKIHLQKDFYLGLKRLFKTFPFFLFRMFKIYKYAPKKHNILQKIKWALYYNEIVIGKVDIIHLQWIGQFSLVGWIKHLYTCPFVSSVRGAQVTYMIDTIPGYVNTITNAFNGSDYIHCVSKSLMERCIFLSANPAKVFVNYNGVNLNKFSPNEKKTCKDKIVRLITVSSLTWRKGIIYQLLALKKLKEQCPDKKVELLIVGEGPENIQIQYTSKRMGLDKDIILAGKKNESEIVTLLKSADIYLTTSSAEGLSNSVMEGLASGLPVITFDCEGAEELIDDGENGFIVTYGDIDQYSKCLQMLINNPEKLVNMSIKARAKMENEFNIDIHADQMIAFYKNVSKSD